MSHLIITGTPVVELEFLGVPSVNRFYNMHYHKRSQETAEWKFEAKEKCREKLLWDNVEPVDRALVVVKVYPPFEEISDIHNVHIKPLLDGITDSYLWKDDEWAFVPVVMFMWAGLGEHKPRELAIRRTVIEIHTLESLTIDGAKQRLPAGRTKL